MPANPNLRGELPGYVFDTRLAGGRYRHVLPDGRLGRIVSRDEIVGLLRTVSDASGAKFAGLARAAVEGRISASELFYALRSELRALYNSAATLARGGWSQMDAAAWGRNGQILRGEYAHLARFCAEIETGNLTVEQAAARARLYSGRAYSRYWAEDAMRQAAGGMTEERWIDTKLPNECSDCIALAARGWVPIGSLGTVPGAGDTQCLGNCRCSISYR